MKKNKKIIIIVITLLLITTISIITYLYFTKDKNKENNLKTENTVNKENNQENNKEIEYKYAEEGPAFFCSNKETYEKTYHYDKGDYIYCEIAYEINSKHPGITEMWFETTHDDDIEYIEIMTIAENWKLDSKNGVINIKTDEPSSYGDGKYRVKFRITPSTKKEKLQILFKNIKYKNANNEYYKTDDSIIDLSINKETNYKFESSEKNDKITFYKFDKTKGYEKINEYICESDTCFEHAAQCFGIHDLENGKTAIYDGENTVFYNFEKGVTGKYGHTIYTLNDRENKKTYYYVSDIKTKKYGIIDIDGNIIKDFTMEQLDKLGSCDLLSNTYSIKHDLIVEKKNNKYGIIKITKDEVVVEHIYDDIRIYNDKYYKAKLEDKWYLYSYETKEKVHEQGYKEIFFATDNILVTQIDNYLYIKDYNGNNIIEDKIQTYIDYNEKACCATPIGIYVNYNKENNKIQIEVSSEETYKPEYNYDIYKYEYEINNKKLTKIDK